MCDTPRLGPEEPSLAGSATCITVPGQNGDTPVYFYENGGQSRPEGDQEVVVFFMGDHVEATGGSVQRLASPFGILTTLSIKYPNAVVLVVRPNFYEQDCIACYQNFLHQCTRTGEPLGHNVTGWKALRHLHAILAAVREPAGLRSLDTRVSLLGFSKGGVVLNQILTEMANVQAAQAGESGGPVRGGPLSPASRKPEEEEEAASPTHSKNGASLPALHCESPTASSPAPPSPHAAPVPKSPSGVPPPSPKTADEMQQIATFLVPMIHTVHFLDVGLNSRGAYLTDPRVLQSLGSLGQAQPLHFAIHGTPRQWQDHHRPWIMEEKDRCLYHMKKAGCEVKEKSYFADRQLSMEMHFEIVDAFDPNL